MKTLLVLAEHPGLAEAVRSVVNPDQYRVVHRSTVEEAEAILIAGLLDVCLIDVELENARGIWILESLMRRLRQCPVVVFSGSRQWEWEEEAYLKGVSYVLNKPVRGRLLNALLERLGKKEEPRRASTPATATAFLVAQQAQHPDELMRSSAQSLQAVGDFSAILTHSLHAEPMLRQFLLMIREMLGVNRSAIFLRRPLPQFGSAPAAESRCLRSTCALGLTPGLLEHFQLSFESGIGGYLFREGRILRRSSPESMADVEMQKEFEILGAQVAIPILDRETLIGVAALDGRVTGEPLSSAELALIFHLLEELGLAVKNIWLHEQVAANHEMMANILRELSSACVVVSRDLAVQHANKMARNFFAPPGRRNSELEFNDLPQLLGSKVYQVLQTGSAVVPFKYQPPESPNTIYQVAIVPFQKPDSALPNSALLIVEDQTQSEQLKHLEVETNNLRLVRNMAERLAHEINNAVMPLDTYRQFMEKELKEITPVVKNAQFWLSLYSTLTEGVKRISRRGAQMRVLAQDAVVSKDVFELSPVIQEAYAEAQKHHTNGSPKLNLQGNQRLLMVSGDQRALTLALAEIFLNALQTNTKEEKLNVRIQTESGDNGNQWAHLEIRDNGPGFTGEALQKACEPFYRTKVIGLGLGLTVAQKIIEMHEGKLTVSNAPDQPAGMVRVSLPLDSSSATK